MAIHAAKIAIDPALTMRIVRLFCSASGLRPFVFYRQTGGQNPEKPPFRVVFRARFDLSATGRIRFSRLPNNF
jgi:hypothetical protein